MIDDLTLKGVTEPYRMFTSRAEFRLSLRADNADQRLTPYGAKIGCISEERRAAFLRKQESLSAVTQRLTDETFTPQQVNAVGIKVRLDGSRRTAYQLLSIPGTGIEEIRGLIPEVDTFPLPTLEQVAKDALYANYITRQKSDVDALKRDEAHAIPYGLDYLGMSGLSNEIARKLDQARPKTIAQAARIEGVTPAALTLILGRIRQSQRKQAT